MLLVPKRDKHIRADHEERGDDCQRPVFSSMSHDPYIIFQQRQADVRKGNDLTLQLLHYRGRALPNMEGDANLEWR